VVGNDAPVFVSDAATKDASVARDVLPIDGLLSTADAWTATSGTDASTSSTAPDGGFGLADAVAVGVPDTRVATSDGSRSGSVDGSGHDAGAGIKTGASGCGCTVGGYDARTAWSLPMVIVGLVAFRCGTRRRRAEAKR
jgi:MYXO-CTERM domain-containing protein